MLFAFFHCVNCRVACLVSIKFIVFVCLVAGVCRPCTHLYNESTMKQFLTKPNENTFFPALYQVLSSENMFLDKCRATATIVESNFSLRRKPCCHGWVGEPWRWPGSGLEIHLCQGQKYAYGQLSWFELTFYRWYEFALTNVDLWPYMIDTVEILQ